jgi:hypothetical protein
MYRHGQLVRLALCERLWARAQISPPDLNIRERLGMTTLGFRGVAGPQTPLLLDLADEFA